VIAVLATVALADPTWSVKPGVDGPILAIDGVIRWRACDLTMRLHQEFGMRPWR